MSYWIVQALNGLQFSMLLFLLSIGLTVILGLMHFVNLAHGALFALGAYVATSLFALTGYYWGAAFSAPIAVALASAVLYLAFIRRMRDAGPMNQVLVTFGLIFVLHDLFRIVFGDYALSSPEPALFTGRVAFLGVEYPTYRLFVIFVGLLVLSGLWLLLARTQIGTMIRAGVDNDRMAACLGINVERLFFYVFCLGCALAGLAGAIAAPILSVMPQMGTQLLIPTLVVVVIGGLGSLRGAITGSLLVGMTQTFGSVLAPQLASVAIYALLAFVLIMRPAGLFPSRT